LNSPPARRRVGKGAEERTREGFLWFLGRFFVCSFSSFFFVCCCCCCASFSLFLAHKYSRYTQSLKWTHTYHILISTL
jgi:hypothetical protein